MIKNTWRTALLLLAVFLVSAIPVSAQGTRADYDRAFGLREKWQGLAVNLPDRPSWIERTNRFWYRKTVPGGYAFIVVDAASLSKAPAFDQEKLAAALAKVSGEKVASLKLPFFMIRFAGDGKSVEFEAFGSRWSCDLASYECKKLGPAERRGGGFSMWERGPKPQAASAEAKTSPDGKWEAFIRNYNVWARVKGADKKDDFPLSFDGGEGDYYTYESIAWSADSKNMAAYRLRRGYHRVIQYVESSPADQLQPRYPTMEYAKPGDALDIERPVLFHVAAKERVEIDPALFGNPYEMSEIVWRKDGRAFTFEYNQRGHQVYRVIEVDAAAGRPRALISEEPETFFDYSGKKYRRDLSDGGEIVWMSERDGWNHLYLYDGATGRVKNQITKGEWVVRGVEAVDEDKRQVVFQASGDDPAIDPYYVRLYRINLDGTGMTLLSGGNFHHATAWSADKAFFVDTRSRVDAPPVMELRDGRDGKVVMTVESADIAPLIKAGWKAPEVFTAKARDGKTDIWGIIIRPTNFDPKKKYPVIEYIYAGPHSSFVPKSFIPFSAMQTLAELGFIVVQVDGMGTSNRSKAFHDVCWKNLGDAGFPDRILWHKAIAAKYPWYDITRVGIYGNSAGGQNALGAVLFHPEFYKVSVSSCGCHDNRMDKIWWNEQWMGWPLGPEYAASSNVDNAWRLQGKLLLIVGEMDTNVDPSSTMQVVNALIKADKFFDLLVIPGGGHGMGGAYGERKMADFFVRNLLRAEPPDRNGVGPQKTIELK